jgi:hypothetical protein
MLWVWSVAVASWISLFVTMIDPHPKPESKMFGELRFVEEIRAGQPAGLDAGFRVVLTRRNEPTEI